MDSRAPSRLSGATQDHRTEVAAVKRERMRARLLEATMLVFSASGISSPVIDDVVKQAGVSRGTFYLYFKSLDEALSAVATEQADQMITDIWPVYDILSQPWQRFVVGFRLPLMRARVDSTWASFVTRLDAVAPELVAPQHIARDLRLGQELGQFAFDDLEVAVNFTMSACMGCARSLGTGVENPQSYIEAAVDMALRGVACPLRLRQQALKFSRTYLSGLAEENAERPDLATWLVAALPRSPQPE